MLKFDDIILEKKGAIATMYLNRIEKRNALNLNCWRLIPILLKDINSDDNIKVIVIRGRDGSAFASGADIEEMELIGEREGGFEAFDDIVERAEKALQDSPKPVIAMIQKFCIGGGCEVALACDLRFTSSNGIFGITPSKLGIVYNVAATKNLVDAVGPSNAKDILFTGRFIDADEALKIGLVDRVYPDEEIVKVTYEYAELIAKRAQKSVKGAKKIIRDILDGDINYDEIYRLRMDAYHSNDLKEGISSFIEKRSPAFNDI